MRSNFIVLALLMISINIISVNLLNVNEVVYNSLIESLTTEQIEEFLGFQKKWEWLSYCVLPLFLLIKISIITAILDIGCFVFDKEIKYSKLFNIAVKAEFVFLLVIVFKTIWFYFFQQDYTLEDLQYFYPFSVLNIIGYDGLQPWFIYPLQIVNLFEVVYWLILVYFLEKELQITPKKGFSIVASSYGTGLLIWVVGVMFLTLNMS